MHLDQRLPAIEDPGPRSKVIMGRKEEEKPSKGLKKIVRLIIELKQIRHFRTKTFDLLSRIVPHTLLMGELFDPH